MAQSRLVGQGRGQACGKLFQLAASETATITSRIRSTVPARSEKAVMQPAAGLLDR
jgi:hypothetical protein